MAEIFKEEVSDNRLQRTMNVRIRIQKLLDRNVESNIKFGDLEKFLVKHLIIASASFKDYHNHKISSKRLRVLFFMKLMSLLTSIRYMSSAVANNELVSIKLMADPHYLLGHKRLNSAMLSLATIMANLLVGGVHLFLEMNGRLTVLTFFRDIEDNGPNIYKLNQKFHRKFCLKKTLLTKYALNTTMYLPQILLNVVYFFGLTALAYMDPQMNFSLVSIVFWDFVKLIFVIDLFAIIMGGFSYYYLSTLFLKYQFMQLDQEIKDCVKSNDITRLGNAIYDHNKVSVTTNQLNQMFKFLLFIVFTMVRFPLNGLLYVSHAPDTNIYARVVMAILFSTTTGILLAINLMSASVAKWAHNNYKLMYSVFNCPNISAYNRLKIQNFVERLSGPLIGFYCFNMFAVNKFQFYEFIAGWMSNYFLIIELYYTVISNN